MNYKILSYKEEIKQLQRGKMCIPRFVDLHLSYACNQNCRGCAFADWNRGFVSKKEDVFRYMNELIDYGVRAFDIAGGGEPTMLPYLKELIEYILSRDCNYGLITNGMMLNDELIGLVANTATYIRVSLEASYPQVYSHYKRVPIEQFIQVINNIEQLIKRKHKDTEISLKFSVDKYLDDEKNISEAVGLVMSLGVDMAIWKANTGETELNDKRKVKLATFLDNLIVDYLGDIKFINSICYRRNVPQCWLNSLHTLVDGYGDVYICCYYYERKDRHRLGNLNDRSFKEIWESDEHLEKIKNIKKEECAKYDCKFFSHHEIIDEMFVRGRLDIL